jgi:rhodanese-related sulfurtransferase
MGSTSLGGSVNASACAISSHLRVVQVVLAVGLVIFASCSNDPSETADAAADLGADLSDLGEDVSAVGPDALGEDVSDPEPSLVGIAPTALRAELEDKDFLLINVHVPYAGEIAGTDAHIPYTDNDTLRAFIGADTSRSVVLYCLTDHMALLAGDELVEQSYRRIRYLEGGMQAWEAAGLPIVRE